MFSVRFGVALAIAGASAAMATTPSPILFGVKRVVISCEASSSLSDAERRALCNQLVKKAGAITSLPVALATSDDTDLIRGDRARQKTQLLLRVSAESRDVESGRKSLSLEVIAVKQVGGPLAPPLKSTASFVRVQDQWVLQGPIDAFVTLLRGAPPKLHKPLTSDI